MVLFSRKTPFEKLKQQIETVDAGWFGSQRTPKQQFERLIFLEYKIEREKGLSGGEITILERLIGAKRLQIELKQRK